jgi:hypothetical protein
MLVFSGLIKRKLIKLMPFLEYNVKETRHILLISPEL